MCSKHFTGNEKTCMGNGNKYTTINKYIYCNCVHRSKCSFQLKFRFGIMAFHLLSYKLDSAANNFMPKHKKNFIPPIQLYVSVNLSCHNFTVPSDEADNMFGCSG